MVLVLVFAVLLLLVMDQYAATDLFLTDAGSVYVFILITFPDRKMRSLAGDIVYGSGRSGSVFSIVFSVSSATFKSIFCGGSG